MPISHDTVIFDVHDAKVYPMLTDAVGASPTYGTAVDVPGIAQVGLDPNIVSAELKGDGRVMAKKGRTDRMNFSATYGKIAMDALAVIIGGDVEDAGTGTTETATFRLKAPASLPYFKIAVQIQDVDVGLGDITLIMYKAQLTGGTLFGTSSDNFGQPTFNAESIALDGDLTQLDGSGTDTGVMFDAVIHETLTPLT